MTVKHLYHFSQITKRMGVIVEDSSGLKLYMKGATEEILKLCHMDINEELAHTILHFSRQGYRLLAYAYKNLTS